MDRLEEGVVLFRREPCHWYEPMRVVARPVGKRPLPHPLSNLIGDARI